MGVLFLVALFVFGLFLNPSPNISQKEARLERVVLFCLPLSGMVTFFSGLETILSSSWIVNTAFSQMPWEVIGIFAIAIFGCYGSHLVNYKVVRTLRIERPFHRMFFYLLTALPLSLILVHDARLWFTTVLVAGIYFLLLDLFSEDGQNSIVWSIVWNIVISSFLTLAIVYFLPSDVFDSGQSFLLNAFSMFSLSFILTSIIFILMATVNRRNSLLPPEWDFNFSHSRQLRNRIQVSILLTLLFSFIAIGLVSIIHIRQMGESSSSFIMALLNTYVFLFLIGFAISVRLAEYIRTPLIQLGKTLKAVKLNKDNEKIPWEGNDELGNLIGEYNHMIDQLRENAQLLAQTERDRAWREMAKQVAHEIKNPLTPMKLSLQHLEKTIRSQREGAEAITLRMCETLMSQIENLRQIADEFSNFGSLPKANNEMILLNDIVETIHDLFRKRGDMDINLIEPIDDIGVYADKNHLLRVLNNLVKNSIQAIPEERKGVIELKLWKEGSKALIRVRDNGTGIPPAMRSQIFKPRFTTKSSGSGLGLAISANMIDSIGGRIYFESTADKGTDFFVELPLIRNKYSENGKRVALDEA